MPFKHLAVLAVLASSSPCLADNPYAAAGITEPAHVTQFLARLQRAIAAGDRAAVAAMVRYPLHVYATGQPPRTYRDAITLRANYPNIFTPDIVNAIAIAKPDKLFARDQGVMIGNGEVWMNEIAGSMKIVTVNRVQ